MGMFTYITLNDTCRRVQERIEYTLAMLSRWCFLIVSKLSKRSQSHSAHIQGSPGNAARPLMDKPPNGVMLWSFSSSSFNKWMHPSFSNDFLQAFGITPIFNFTTFLEQEKHLYFFGSERTHICSLFWREGLQLLKGWNHGWDLMHSLGTQDSSRPLNPRQCALCQQLPVTPVGCGPSSLAASIGIMPWFKLFTIHHLCNWPHHRSFLCQVAET